jgi:hypothetical protein
MAEQDNSYHGLRHRTIIEMAKEVGTGKLSAEAAAQGHDAYFPVPVAVQNEQGKTVIRGQARKPVVSQRGKIFVFLPTREKVTILRTKVGEAYDGTAIHEVATREGKKFLSSQKQLKESV